jgi:hypothetical protein
MKKWKPQNMRLINREDSSEMGVCYPTAKQTWVTLHKQLSEDTIIDTSVEETLHQCLSMLGMDEKSDGEQEEWFIEQAFWAMRGWILDEE